MKLLYLDESGDHDLTRIDPDYPIFVIGGIIVDRTYVRTAMEPIVQAFKRKWFGTDSIILHSADISRSRNGFELLRSDRQIRDSFMIDLSKLMADLEYQVVACIIHKDNYRIFHGDLAPDPYEAGLEAVVERFCIDVGDKVDEGLIFAEKRRADLDHDLDVAWERLRMRGLTSDQQHQFGQIDDRIIGLSLKSKLVNIAGLQIADLVVSTVGRYAAGLNTHDNWSIVQRKLRRKGDEYEGHGLIRLPSPWP